VEPLASGIPPRGMEMEPAKATMAV
jgi:hypothetical protein